MLSEPETESGNESVMEVEDNPTTRPKNEDEDEPTLFPTATTAKKGMIAKTTRELDIMSLSQEIRERERWMDVVNDGSIPECLQRIEDKKVVQYIVDELKYYASLCSGGIEVGAIDGTWQADNLIDPKLKKDFRKYVQDNLETEDESQKDYHPWNRRVVVDLVHPSLYCYVEGVSKVNKLDDKLDNIQDEVEPEAASSEDNVSEPEDPEKKPASLLNESGDLDENFGKHIFKYQWLPSEFHVDDEGKVFINSYINNLDPTKHSALYTMIGQIFEKFIPLFNNVLSDLLNMRENRIILKSDWRKGDSDKYELEFDRPEIPKFTPPEIKSERVDLRGRNLQVIVKLTNIELTPKEPKFSGGLWHVEGISTEAIVATGVYYYSSSNITQSRLSFRQGIEVPDHTPGDEKGVRELYDLENGSILSQQLGSIVCSEDRCIAFPNIYQHKVNEFSLKDKTKSGHRKILAFLLVEPNKRILSTKHVAPQQDDWADKAKLDPTRKPIVTAAPQQDDWADKAKLDPTRNPIKVATAARQQDDWADKAKLDPTRKPIVTAAPQQDDWADKAKLDPTRNPIKTATAARQQDDWADKAKLDPTRNPIKVATAARQQDDWADKAKLDPTRKIVTMEAARKYRENLMISRKYDPTKDLYEFDMRHSFYERKFVLNEANPPDLNK